jgi:hypothetical protein
VEISKINLSPFTDSLSLSLSRIRQQSHRGSRFARRFEALGKAHPGREALHLARVGVLRRFGWDCLGKLGRPFHEGDPNPRGTFSSFALSLSLEMCASIFTNSYSPRVCHDANTTLTEIHSLHRRERSMDSKLPSRTSTLVRLCDRDHVFRFDSRRRENFPLLLLLSLFSSTTDDVKGKKKTNSS